MAEAGLTYAGSATLADNHPTLLMDRQAAEAMAALPNARLRHLAEDFAVNRRFRRDVFIRGARASRPHAEALRDLEEMPIGCASEIERIDTRMTIPRGTLSFQPQFIADLRTSMQQGALPIGEIVARLGRDGHNRREILQNLLFLVASGSLTPFAHPGGYVKTGARRAASPAVAAALACNVDGTIRTLVPSVTLGNGVVVDENEATRALSWIAGEEAAPPARLARLGVLCGA